jgi:Domain of unknown function (DUF4440)
MILNRLALMTLAAAALLEALPAKTQQGQWAAATDETARQMISWERQWAEEACTPRGIVQTILADDFQGTSTEGKRYTKPEEVESNKPGKNEARDCRLQNARVRFFGDQIALIYGSESSMRKSGSGKEYKKCQVWTDTWLKRNGSWQIVAAQDTQVSCKQSSFND